MLIQKRWVFILMLSCMVSLLAKEHQQSPLPSSDSVSFKQSKVSSCTKEPAKQSTDEVKCVKGKDTYFLLYRMGYFHPFDGVFRKIYHPGISYQVEFDALFFQKMLFFSNLDYFPRSGHSIRSQGAGDTTELRLAGFSAGLGYYQPFGYKFAWYVGIGPKIFYLDMHDKAPFVFRHVQEFVFGFQAKTGFRREFTRHIIGDVFVDYSYGYLHYKFNPSELITRYSINIGGLAAGGAIGFSF